MPVSDKDLHLPDLSIKEFRGIKDLSISRLGRVTLFAGKNGVGKTTLLDAVRIYAARGRYPVLTDILRNREELTDTIDEDGEEMLMTNFEALFHGWHSSSDARISIGPMSRTGQLHIRTAPLSQKEAMRWRKHISEPLSDDDLKMLKVEFQGSTRDIPVFLSLFSRRVVGRVWDDESDFPPETGCQSLGPSLLSNMAMARFWDKAALTDDETRAVQALNLIFDNKVERVAVIGDDRRSHSLYGRRVVVKRAGQDRPVPLKSLGDGAVRLFGVALALANSRDGFLVIDEAENGIHYSVQRDFWKMVLRTAHENNVQVFATTHGWDCVAGFAQAATDIDEVEGVLIRLEEDGSRIRAVEYSEDDLKTAAEQGIEVR